MELSETVLPSVDSITHLGITRGKDGRGNISLDDMVLDRTSTTSATVYALMGAGMHGANGLPPAVSMKMYTTYALPRLLYGLDTVVLKI